MQIQPVSIEAVLGIVMGCLMLLIPIAGLTARFALKPIVEAIARARESGGGGKEAIALVERRLALVEQELQSISAMRDDVAKLVEDQDFRRELARPISHS